MDILKELKKRQDMIDKIREDLHQIPEIGLDLPKTKEYIVNFLKKRGLDYKEFNGLSGLSVDIKCSKPGDVVAVRTDMDALKVVEMTGLDYQSTNGNMHACGHDGHMAATLVVLDIVNEFKEDMKGIVRFIFQPAEEYPGGARPLIEQGILNDPKVDRIIGFHNGSIFKELEFGKIGVRKGPIMGSMDRFYIEIDGLGGHGSTPEKSIDPIVALLDISRAIYDIKTRELASSENFVISICHVQSGVNQNIIPDKAVIEGTVRTFNDEVRVYIRDRITEISTCIAKAHRCSASVLYDWKYPVVVNDDDETEKFSSCVKELFGEESLVHLENPIPSGEDMGFYLMEVPGVYFMLSNHKEIKGKKYPHHSSKFDLDTKELYKAAAAILKYIQC